MRSTCNPFKRLAADTERRAALAALTPAQQAAAGASSTGGACLAGQVSDTTGEWVGFGRLDLDPLSGFALGA